MYGSMQCPTSSYAYNQAGYALRRDLKLKLKLKLKVVFGGQTRVLFIMSIPG